MPVTRFTRKEFFDLIWSKPMRDAAAGIGISDVALRKAALKAELPLPPRGHWNRIAAGKRGFPKPALPPRGFGAPDEVTFGSEPWEWPRRQEIGPPPREPQFDEPMEAVRARAVAQIGKATVPRDLERCHPAIRHMLSEEERRAEKAKESPYLASYNAPRLAGPLDRRRLRIANAIALAVARTGLRGAMRDVEDVAVGYGSDHGWLRISVVANAKPKRGERADGLRVVFEGGFGEADVAGFADAPDGALETRIAEIAVEIAVEVEARYRAGRMDAFRREVEARERRIEEARLAVLEAERKERERREALERARVERLLAQAERLRQADAIRAFVAEVGRRIGPEADAYARWSAWATAQADRIDPTRDLGFLLEVEDAE